MTTDTIRLKAAYRRTGLAFLGMSFESAMAIKAIRITIECAVKAQDRLAPKPVQPKLI